MLDCYVLYCDKLLVFSGTVVKLVMVMVKSAIYQYGSQVASLSTETTNLYQLKGLQKAMNDSARADQCARTNNKQRSLR